MSVWICSNIAMYMSSQLFHYHKITCLQLVTIGSFPLRFLLPTLAIGSYRLHGSVLRQRRLRPAGASRHRSHLAPEHQTLLEASAFLPVLVVAPACV